MKRKSSESPGPEQGSKLWSTYNHSEEVDESYVTVPCHSRILESGIQNARPGFRQKHGGLAAKDERE